MVSIWFLIIYFVADFSQLGTSILGNVFWGWGWEQIWGELSSLGHISLDLHLSSHESILWVKFSETNVGEILIQHGEGGISLLGLTDSDLSLSIFQVNSVGLDNGSSLLSLDSESENRLDLWNKGLSFSSIKESLHHSEDLFTEKSSSWGSNSGNSLGLSLFEFFLNSLNVLINSVDGIMSSGWVFVISIEAGNLLPSGRDFLWGEWEIE